MIAFLSGTITAKEAHALLLNVQGVGYRVFCSLEVIASAKKGQEIFVHIHHHITESDMSLYGFAKKEDLEFFEKLISISGIGPKIALGILESPSNLVKRALEDGDVSFLKSLKGIGKKTAERMVVELRGNLPLSDEASALPSEVVEALSDLGFERMHIQKAFQNLPGTLNSSEEMVKWFLQNHAL